MRGAGFQRDDQSQQIGQVAAQVVKKERVIREIQETMYHRVAVSIGCDAVSTCVSSSFPVLRTASSRSSSPSEDAACRSSVSSLLRKSAFSRAARNACSP